MWITAQRSVQHGSGPPIMEAPVNQNPTAAVRDVPQAREPHCQGVEARVNITAADDCGLDKAIAACASQAHTGGVLMKRRRVPKVFRREYETKTQEQSGSALSAAHRHDADEDLTQRVGTTSAGATPASAHSTKRRRVPKVFGSEYVTQECARGTHEHVHDANEDAAHAVGTAGVGATPASNSLSERGLNMSTNTGTLSRIRTKSDGLAALAKKAAAPAKKNASCPRTATRTQEGAKEIANAVSAPQSIAPPQTSCLLQKLLGGQLLTAAERRNLSVGKYGTNPCSGWSRLVSQFRVQNVSVDQFTLLMGADDGFG
jgi:hypothetical protein